MAFSAMQPKRSLEEFLNTKFAIGCPLMTREVILKKTGTVILIRPSLLRIIVSLLLAMGQKPTFCRQITDVCYVPGTDVAQFQSLCLTGQPPAMAAEGVASPFPAH
jgi:hypothetical protein